MYLDHFGLDEPPFRITPHIDFFFGGANRGATLEALLYAITNDEGIVKVSGEVGSGKTMLCRVLMERLPANVETIYLANPSLARDEILIAIADELEVAVSSERSMRMLRSLQIALIERYAQGQRVVVLIDEAHAMPKETLEEIRLLSNLESNRHKLLQIALFGQPEMDAHLNTPEMRQLKERITHSFRLEPLLRGDIESYIEFRLRAAGYRGPNPFIPGAIRLIAEASEGLTRRVNILSDKSLLAAFAANTHTITEREVKRAVEDSEFYRPPRRYDRLGLAAAGTAIGLAVGFGIAWTMLRDEPALRTASGSVTPVPPAQPATVAPPAQFAAQQKTADAERAAGGLAAAPAAEPAAQAPEQAASTAPQPSVSSSADPAAPRAQLVAERDSRAGAPAEPRALSARPSGPTPPVRGKLVQQRFRATQEWLMRAPEKHYAIQLITVKNTELGHLEDFIARASKLVPEDELHVYSVKIDGGQHYRLAYGNYPSPGEAQSAMKELPPFFRAQIPYHRSVERMRSQNRQ